MHKLASKVRPWTRGLRAVFVCNFQRGVKPDAVQFAFGFDSMDMVYTDKDTGKIKSLAERIKNGKYDIVIVRTKFISHYVERGIAQACRDYGVHYLRAGNASVAQIAQSAIRDMGIDFTAEPPPPPQPKPRLSIVKSEQVIEESMRQPNKKEPTVEDIEYSVLSYVDGKDRVTMLEILEQANVEIPYKGDSPDWHRLSGKMQLAGRIMTDLGFVRKQSMVEGRKERYWIRKSLLKEAPPNRVSPPDIDPIKFEKFTQAFIEGKNEFEPEEIFKAGDFPLPMKDGKIAWTTMTRFTRIMAKVARAQGFEATQKRFDDGSKRRVWVKGKLTGDVKIVETPKPDIKGKVKSELPSTEKGIEIAPSKDSTHEPISLPLSRSEKAMLIIPKKMDAGKYEILKKQLDALIELRKMQAEVLEE